MARRRAQPLSPQPVPWHAGAHGNEDRIARIEAHQRQIDLSQRREIDTRRIEQHELLPVSLDNFAQFDLTNTGRVSPSGTIEINSYDR